MKTIEKLELMPPWSRYIQCEKCEEKKPSLCFPLTEDESDVDTTCYECRRQKHHDGFANAF